MSVHSLKERKDQKENIDKILNGLNTIYEKYGWKKAYNTLFENISELQSEAVHRGYDVGFTAGSVVTLVAVTISGSLYYFLK